MLGVAEQSMGPLKMFDKQSGRNGNGQENTEQSSIKRRLVLQGVAALGLGSATVGSATAEERGDWEPGDGKPPWANDDRGEDDDAAVPTAIQLYTLRNLPDSTTDLIRRVGAVDNNGGPGFDAVEFAGLGSATASEIKTTLEETGVNPASAHVGLEALEGESFESTVATYKEIGVNTFIVPYLSPSSIDTVEKVESLAQRMNKVAANLREYNARLGFHNHDGEFQEIGDGTTPLETFAETLNEEVIFEIDVGWVLTAGYDPVEVIKQYSGRTELIHMKDMEDGEFREIGEGAVDMREVAQVARKKADVDYLIYEHDAPSDPAGSVATGAGVLSLLDGEEGPECIELSDMGGPNYSGDLGDGKNEDDEDDEDEDDEDEDDEEDE
ncbi:sugar phosphate isomerase/epimerase family protein [Halococcus sediminicola]|uniref:sugar phosphate isomerase/epimerase family protein n=1 Tax=Halococcus sediminicola TaxID=1264579 RepID=UPI0009ADB85A|nr:sugar phosphate isomerase/epimerase [Halococcus sediminicola]